MILIEKNKQTTALGSGSVFVTEISKPMSHNKTE